MGRSIDENLWNSWRQRLTRYERWAGTVAAFCDREGVPLATFYQWRRKLGVEGDVSPAQRRGPEAPDVTPRFLPVRIEAPEPIEIELPNDVRVRVPLGVYGYECRRVCLSVLPDRSIPDFTNVGQKYQEHAIDTPRTVLCVIRKETLLD